MFDLAISPEKPNRVFAGTRGDGVGVSEDLGDRWKLPNRGKPSPKKVRCLAIDRAARRRSQPYPGLVADCPAPCFQISVMPRDGKQQTRQDDRSSRSSAPIEAAAKRWLRLVDGVAR